MHPSDAKTEIVLLYENEINDENEFNYNIIENSWKNKVICV